MATILLIVLGMSPPRSRSSSPGPATLPALVAAPAIFATATIDEEAASLGVLL